MKAESIQCTGVCRLAESHGISAVTASFCVLKIKNKIICGNTMCLSYSWFIVVKWVMLQQSHNAIFHLVKIFYAIID